MISIKRIIILLILFFGLFTSCSCNNSKNKKLSDQNTDIQNDDPIGDFSQDSGTLLKNNSEFPDVQNLTVKVPDESDGGILLLKWQAPGVSSKNRIKIGYEIWQGPGNGFTVTENSLSDNGGTLIVPMGDLNEEGSYLVENLNENSEYSFFIRYIYEVDDGSKFFSPGVIIRGKTKANELTNNFNSSLEIKPVENLQITDKYFDKVKLNFNIPEQAVYVEIYYSRKNQTLAQKESGNTLVGSEHKYNKNYIYHTNLKPGNYYYTIYAVFFDGTNYHYSEAAPNVDDEMLRAEVLDKSHFEIIFNQEGLAPEQIESQGAGLAQPGIANTYNFDQNVTLSLNETLSHEEGAIRYTLNGDEPNIYSYEYTGDPILVTDGEETIINAAFVRADGTMGQVYSKRYKVNYNVYNCNLILDVKKAQTKTLNSKIIHYSSSDISITAKYTPVCGELFSIFKKQSIAETLNNQDLGNGETFAESMNSPDPVKFRFDTIHEPEQLLSNKPAIAKSQLTGRNRGGNSAETTFMLKINNRQYNSDPLNSAENNPDIDPSLGNIKQSNSFVIYPGVNVSIDMYRRPAVTPYIWTEYEPIIQVDVFERDFFTDAENPLDDVACYFRIQYAAKDYPYGNSSNSINWNESYNADTNSTLAHDILPWQDPDFTESENYQAVTGKPLEYIDPNPFGFTGSKWDVPMKITETVSGRAYYQIDNPYDTAKIGEESHYAEINNENQSGELDHKAFRTAVRFRVAIKPEPGKRDAEVKRSFESNTSALFKNSDSEKKYTAGVLGNASEVSDFPEQYRSYPIEVFEAPQGWTFCNHYNLSGGNTAWFNKYGTKWLHKNKEGHENHTFDSINKYFNPDNKKVVIFTHGWEGRIIYELLMYRGRPWNDAGDGLYNNSETYENTAIDYEDWLKSTIDQGEKECEWLSNGWIDEGYNIGYFHWVTLAMEGSLSPDGAQRKIWDPIGFAKMKSTSVNDKNTYLADVIRSANLGMLFAQSIVDSFPEGYTPDFITVVGNSLGGQITINATKKMIESYERMKEEGTPEKLPLSMIPDKIDTLDPYWSKHNDYYAGKTTRLYSDYIHEWGKTNGDDFDGDGDEDSAGIPIQWIRTTAITQPVLWGIGNDSNSPFIPKTNYQKIYMIQKYDGYVRNGTYPFGQYKEMSPHAHGECIWWYFRSIERKSDSENLDHAISAQSKIGQLFTRLDAIRDNNNWTFYETEGGENPSSASPDGGRKTITTLDDNFIQQSASSGLGNGKPEYD